MLGCADRVGKTQPFIGIEIEDQPVGLFNRIASRLPRVEFDRAHLHAGQQAGCILDIEIIVRAAVTLDDGDLADVRAERSAVVLLKETLLAAALRTAHQTDRAAAGKRQHQRRYRGVVIGQIALGLAAFGKDHAVAAADRHAAWLVCRSGFD